MMSESVRVQLGDGFGEGKLADLPFAIEGEAREYFVMAERQPSVVDAFGRTRPSRKSRK